MDHFSSKPHGMVGGFHFKKSNQTAILKLTLSTNNNQPII
jgi:hypothetical protein